jgi:SSS family solute:Na+ symporter
MVYVVLKRGHLGTAGQNGQPLGVFIPGEGSYPAYATLMLGAAPAQLMYPHSMTALLSAGGPKVLRRNAAALPVYALMRTPPAMPP